MMKRYTKILYFFATLLGIVPAFAQKSTPDSLKTYIFKWRLNEDFTKSGIALDSSLSNFHFYKHYDRQGVQGVYAHLGNFGSAYSSVLFFEDAAPVDTSAYFYHPLQNNRSDFFFLTNYRAYFFSDKTIPYYNTNKPYTTIFYTTNWQVSDEELSLHFVHSQNIFPNLNATVFYDLINSEGLYSNQTNKKHCFALSTNYTHPRYQAFANFSINKLQANENGGIVDGEIVSDYDDEEEVPVYLDNAVNRLKSREVAIHQRIFFGKKIKIDSISSVASDSLQQILPLDSLTSDTLQHQRPVKSTENDTTNLRDRPKTMKDSLRRTNTRKNISHRQSKEKNDTIKIRKPDYIIEPRISLMHHFRYADNIRLFTDENPDTTFYQHIYFFDETSDSTNYRTISNTIALQMNEIPSKKRFIGGNVAITYDLNKAYNFKHFIKNNSDTSFRTGHVSFTLHNHLNNKLRWKSKASYYFSTYRQNDLTAYFSVSKLFGNTQSHSFVTLSAKYERLTPHYFMQQFSSNHIRWDNSFDKEETSHIRLCYTNTEAKTAVGVNAANVKNLVYFDTDSKPSQYTEQLNVISVFLNKNFTFWKWHLNNHLLYQYVSNTSYLHVPSFVLYNSTYFEDRFFKNNLHIHIGFDVWYFSQYGISAYSPVTSHFYLTPEEKAGNYARVDVFLNAKIKSALIFLKMRNLTSFLFEEAYFPVKNYPMYGAMFEFGMSWRFHN